MKQYRFNLGTGIVQEVPLIRNDIKPKQHVPTPVKQKDDSIISSKLLKIFGAIVGIKLAFFDVFVVNIIYFLSFF
jgi:hypothetical protein